MLYEVITVITDAFAGKRTLERHQMINATMGDRFQTGVVHALSIKQCATPAEQAEGR